MIYHSYADIGKIVERDHPALLQEILPQLPKREVIRNSWFDDVNKLLADFCKYHDVEPEHYQGKLKKASQQSEERKYFISLVMNIYKNRHGINIYTANALKITKQRLSIISQEIETRYRLDKDFKSQVDKIISILQ